MTILDQHFLIRPNAAGVLDSKNPQGTNQGTNLFDGRAIIRRGLNQTDAFDGRASVRTSAVAQRDGKAVIVNNAAPKVPLIVSTPINVWGTWPNSRPDSVAPASVGGNTGFASLTEDWGTAIYNYIRSWYALFGGGHSDYYGNEVPIFDVLGTEAWRLLTQPSNPPAINTGYASDGRPVSRHGYSNNVYAGSVDQMVCMGAGGIANNGFSTTQIDLFQFGASGEPWSRGPNKVGGLSELFCCAAYNKVTGYVWAFAGESSSAPLNRYDPVAKTITTYGCQFGFYQYSVAAIDTKRNQMLFSYQGTGIYRVDLNNPNNQPVLISTAGTGVSQSPQAPGMVYDPVNDQFICWNGGATLYTLSIPTNLTGTWQWGTIPLGAGSSVTPTQPPTDGCFGKFRYMDDLHAVCVWNRTNENGFFRKLPFDIENGTLEYG